MTKKIPLAGIVGSCAALFLGMAAWGASARAAELPRGAQMINLSCLEALLAVGEGRLGGVFAFVQEKDEPAAFADLLVHDPKALKKFLRKVERDFKAAQGIAAWDREVLLTALAIYASPLAGTLDKPGQGTMDRIARLSASKPLTLAELNAKREPAKR